MPITRCTLALSIFFLVSAFVFVPKEELSAASNDDWSVHTFCSRDSVILKCILSEEKLAALVELAVALCPVGVFAFTSTFWTVPQAQSDHYYQHEHFWVNSPHNFVSVTSLGFPQNSKT